MIAIEIVTMMQTGEDWSVKRARGYLDAWEGLEGILSQPRGVWLVLACLTDPDSVGMILSGLGVRIFVGGDVPVEGRVRLTGDDEGVRVERIE